jgi:hypothetical protein
MGCGAKDMGVLLLALGAALTIVIRKRRFDRTIQFNAEQLSSYWFKLGVNNIDGALRYISLILPTVGFLIPEFRLEDYWGWIFTPPVYAFILFFLFGS